MWILLLVLGTSLWVLIHGAMGMVFRMHFNLDYWISFLYR